MGAEEVTSWGDVPEADLRDTVGTTDLVAVREAYGRHGPTAFNVAAAITQDAELAAQAVVTAFVQVATDERCERQRPIRAELLDATRRAAGHLADEPTAGSPRLHSVGPGDVFRSLPLEARSTLALALVARCVDTEIAEIMALDISAVRRTLVVALDRARLILGDLPETP